jgi:EPS-associated MarR family transcriptional regulator
LGSINFCFQALVDKGLVKMQNFSQSKHKIGYVYLLTPAGLAEKSVLTARFLERKLEEYETSHAEIEQLKPEMPQIVNVPPISVMKAMQLDDINLSIIGLGERQHSFQAFSDTSQLDNKDYENHENPRNRWLRLQRPYSDTQTSGPEL